MQRKIRDRSPEQETGSDVERVLLDPMSAFEEEEKDRQFVTALARGLELLRCFSPRESVLSNQELARKANLPRPTVSRLTYTLTRLATSSSCRVGNTSWTSASCRSATRCSPTCRSGRWRIR